MKVNVTDKCHRCKREAPREVDHTEVDAIAAAEQSRLEVAKHVSELLKGAETENADAMPDLIVFFRGQIQIIPQVCEPFCEKTIRNSIDSMFKDISERKGRPKGNGTKAKKDAKAKTPASAVKDSKKDAASSSAKS